MTSADMCSGKAVLLCQSSKKEFYKKFLYEPLPVEVSNNNNNNNTAHLCMRKASRCTWTAWTVLPQECSQTTASQSYE